MSKSFTITDFWRWWVVHLWVEQSFEFFAAAMSAYLLMAVGLVSRKLAERAVYFELILIFLGGVLGTGHHLYWAGGPSMWVPLGSMFSFIEVLPLVRKNRAPGVLALQCWPPTLDPSQFLPYRLGAARRCF
jgi:nitric oxide reductase subunit B